MFFHTTDKLLHIFIFAGTPRGLVEIDALKSIGLTAGEIKVYMALLKESEQTKTSLAINAKVSSSKVYEIASRLTDKGLVNSMKIDGVKTFSAADPASLSRYIQQKEKELQEERELVEELIPRIKEIQQRHESKVGFELHNGWEGLKTASFEALEQSPKGSRIFAIGGQRNIVPESFVRAYHRKRTEKNMSIRIIFTENHPEDKHFGDIQIKCIPEISDVSFSVFPDRVLITSIEEEPVTLAVRHPRIRDSFLQLFDKLWNN